VLISTPSTFAILAGVLGKKKLIIHEKQWIEYAQNVNDLFWIKLTQHNNMFYSVWAIL